MVDDSQLNGAYIAQKHVTQAKDAGLDMIGDVSRVLNYLAVNSSVKPFDDTVSGVGIYHSGVVDLRGVAVSKKDQVRGFVRNIRVRRRTRIFRTKIA